MESTEQTVDPVSVEDRIADIMMGPEKGEAPEVPEEEEAQAEEAPSEDAESEEEVSEEEDTGYVDIEFDGATYQVPPAMKDALMRNEDYTVKTQELSNQRREIELQQKQIIAAQERAAFDASVAEDVNQLNMLNSYIAHVKQSTDWNSMSTEEIVKARIELDNLVDQQGQLKQKLERGWSEFQSNIETKRKELNEETEKALSKAIQGWNEKLRGEVQSYVKGQGYPDQALAQMSSLDYQLAYKAMQFDQLKKGTKGAIKKAEASPTIKPTARKEMPKSVQKKLNYRKQVAKTKDVRARQKLAEDRIADIFS